MGDQRLNHADGARPARVGGQNRLDGILKERERTEYPSLGLLFDVRQFGLFACQVIEGSEILLQPQHPRHLVRDLIPFSSVQWSVHLDAHAASRLLDQHAHYPARIQSPDACEPAGTSVYAKGSQADPAMRFCDGGQRER